MEKIEEQIALGERIHESVVNHETEEIKSSVVLPEDEVNVEAANQVITEPGTATLTHTDGTYEEVQVFPYPEEAACNCTDCVEGSGVDTDLEQIVADMSERLAKLEERIALYNVKASHKI